MNLKEVRAKYETGQEFINAVDAELLKLMEANPEFVYSTSGKSCSYCHGPEGNEDNSTGCIFGQALQALGWDDRIELDSCHDIVGLVIHIVKCPSYWSNIQAGQDSGEQWGELKKFLTKESPVV